MISVHYLHWQSTFGVIKPEIVFQPFMFLKCVFIHRVKYVYRIDWLRVDVLSCQYFWQINRRTDMKYFVDRLNQWKRKLITNNSQRNTRVKQRQSFLDQCGFRASGALSQIIGACKIWRWSTKSSKDLI